MRIGIFTDSYSPFINGVTTSVLMLKKGLEKGLEKGLKPKNGAVLIAIKAKAPIVPVRYTRKF